MQHFDDDFAKRYPNIDEEELFVQSRRGHYFPRHRLRHGVAVFKLTHLRHFLLDESSQFL